MCNCKLCSSPCGEFSANSPLQQAYRVACPRCGEYEITDAAKDAYPEEFVGQHIYLLSALTHRSWDRRERFRIDAKLLTDRSEFETRVLSQCPRKVQAKVDVVLRFIADHSDHPGSNVRQQDITRDHLRLFCKDGPEVLLYVSHLLEQRLLDPVGGGNPPSEVKVAVAGWRRLEESEKPNIESRQAFVAMWFDGQLDTACADGIAKLEEDTGFKPLRIDMKQFNEKICDHIIAEIRRSRFLIADVTGHRQGVYFEAGFAMGLGLPVIWTCHKDHIEQCHFDTRQYNHITWETPVELREKLKDRIIATVGLPH